MNFEKIIGRITSKCPFHILGVYRETYHYKNFIGLQKSIGQQRGAI